jgi:CubicO group peptidase (beta-lactamase class C family)
MRRRAFIVSIRDAALALSCLPGAGSARPIEPISAAQAPAGLRDLVAAMSRDIPDWMRAANVPGVVIAIVNDAKMAWRQGFGVKDAASKLPVSDDTMFEAASMSKPVFAYVVMKLCEAGVMDLDTPLTKYTAERFLPGDARLDLITARHVLSHTTGFQNWRSEKEPLTIHFNPGEKYLYSGEGYNYLQTVVTHVLGQPFETYMNGRLFVPLSMTSSGYVWSDAFARRMARPHDANGRPIDNKKSTPTDVARYGSAGALLTTTADYAKFLIAVIDPPATDAYHLSRSGIREMLRPHVKLEGGQYPASWALGWQIFHNKDRDFIFHGGDNEGFHSMVVGSVEGKSGFVALTNGESGPSVLKNILMADSMQAFLAG